MDDGMVGKRKATVQEFAVVRDDARHVSDRCSSLYRVSEIKNSCFLARSDNSPNHAQKEVRKEGYLPFKACISFSSRRKRRWTADSSEIDNISDRLGTTACCRDRPSATRLLDKKRESCIASLPRPIVTNPVGR